MCQRTRQPPAEGRSILPHQGLYKGRNMEHSPPHRLRFWLLVLLVSLVIPAIACFGSSAGPPADDPAIILKNESGIEICYVLISPTTDDMWGDDQLGDTETIRNGRSRTFEITAGQWDMRALDCNQNEIDVRWEQDISSTYEWTVSN
jgi:hypothetical protein